MQHFPAPSAEPEINDSEPIDASRLPWPAEVGTLLAQAAALCVAQSVDVDSFMRAAWTAYVESRPGMREHLEQLQLLDQLDVIRKNGRMGQA